MDQIVVFMRWESYLSVNDRYTRGTRPRLRPECATWQEELAWSAKLLAVEAGLDVLPENVTLIVDVEIRFPNDEVVRDPDNYLKSMMDGLEMGLGISDSQFIPFVREVQLVPLREAGFTIRVYPANLAGHGLKGRFGMTESGQTVIILDEIVPSAWLNERCVVSVGVVTTEEGCHG